MIRKVAGAMATVSAGLLWRLFNFNDGLFMVLAQDATDAEMAAVAEQARQAVDALQLPHGNSAEHDFVRLLTASVRGHGTDLLTMPAELIRTLDRSPPLQSDGRSHDNGTGMIAA